MTELSLFIYGSLAEGQVHFNKISPYIVSREQASLSGVMYRLPSGYPALIAAAHGEALDCIQGEFVRLQAPDVVCRLLDEYHGYNLIVPEKSLFRRENIEVHLLSGKKSAGYAYILSPSKLPKSALRIEFGQWQQDLQVNPPLFQNLTEQQAQYIRRLSSSSGREIIPIDMALYRELLKLDLIVDKGRRLALSKLGKEVVRYLPEA